MKTKFSGWAGGLLLAAALGPGCAKEAPKPAPPTVTVSQPTQVAVAEALDLNGTVAPSKTVDLVARVPGYLRSVNFQDGAEVAAGDLLFVIEPEPYEQQLKLAQAALMMAQTEYDRQLDLSKENATSEANVEKWLSQRDQAAAQVEIAKLNLGYTRLVAPFNGHLGARQFDPGNMVGVGSNIKLATIAQWSPIYVNFNLNERDVMRLRDVALQRGVSPRANIGKAAVFAGGPTDEGYPHEGTLDFVDTSVGVSLGTVQMRAVFTNADHEFFPGLFVRVHIPLSAPQPLPTVPASAIGSDQEGDYVLVVNASNVVSRRAVVKGPGTESGCAIRSGLALDDRVIVNGLLRARPGATVLPVAETNAPTPAR